MSTFIPSTAQAAAIAEVRNWFENRTDQQQVFRLFGYAGSGKSTVLKFALDDLGISPHRSDKDGSCIPGVVTATFTGKAALVLSRKGTPARTIHSLIYSVIDATEEEIEAAVKKGAGGRNRRPQTYRLRPDRCRGRDRGHATGAFCHEASALCAESAKRCH